MITQSQICDPQILFLQPQQSRDRGGKRGDSSSFNIQTGIPLKRLIGASAPEYSPSFQQPVTHSMLGSPSSQGGGREPGLLLGRPKLITGHPAGRELISYELWGPLGGTAVPPLFSMQASQGGFCIHFSIRKTVIRYWAFFHLQKQEGLMWCQVEQSVRF